MSHVYILTSEESRYAFTHQNDAVEWFMDNIVSEYADSYEDAEERLVELCGPNYLDSSYGALEILLDKFEWELEKVALDPN